MRSVLIILIYLNVFQFVKAEEEWIEEWIEKSEEKESFFQRMKNKVSNAYEGYVKPVGEKVKDFAEAAWDKVTEEETWNTIKNGAEEVYNGFIKPTGQGLSNVIEITKDLITNTDINFKYYVIKGPEGKTVEYEFSISRGNHKNKEEILKLREQRFELFEEKLNLLLANSNMKGEESFNFTKMFEEYKKNKEQYEIDVDSD